MTHITNNSDPAFRYEDLARFAFDNCNKYGDPWRYASQEVYTNFISGIDLKGQRILSTILSILIYNNRGNSKICEKLIQIENSIWTATTQLDAIKIIDDTISIFKNT
jgi:hypothetical protein